jgi:hypothetical protein
MEQMILELIGKGIAGKLFGYGFDAVRDSFRQSRTIEAFEKACIGVVKEESHLFDQYSAQALGSLSGVPDEESLWSKLEQSFADGCFPTIRQLTEMLVECWRVRKRQLNPSDTSEFFSLSESSVRPIIQKISERFFKELAQIPELGTPFIIEELQKISRLVQDVVVGTPSQPLLLVVLGRNSITF